MTKQTTVKGTAAMKEWLKNQGIVSWLPLWDSLRHPFVRRSMAKRSGSNMTCCFCTIAMGFLLISCWVSLLLPIQRR